MRCPECAGFGRTKPGTRYAPCGTCGGSGIVDDRWEGECVDCGTNGFHRRYFRRLRCDSCIAARSKKRQSTPPNRQPIRQPTACFDCGVQNEPLNLYYSQARCDSCIMRMRGLRSGSLIPALPRKIIKDRLEKLLRKVLAQRGFCALCGRRMEPHDALELDHIVPVAQGGPDTEDNLQATHCRCNAKKGQGRKPLVKFPV